MGRFLVLRVRSRIFRYFLGLFGVFGSRLFVAFYFLVVYGGFRGLFGEWEFSEEVGFFREGCVFFMLCKKIFVVRRSEWAFVLVWGRVDLLVF